MEWLIWIGAGITMIGVIMLLYCIRKVAQARSAGLDEDALKRRLQSVVALNLGALGISMIGLMMVVIGVILS